MKKIWITTLFLGAFALLCPAGRANAQVGVSVTIGGFYDELAPYGRWVGCSYGQCWVPSHVARGWQPYTNGQWVYTEYGWTWVSEDPWGGNPYHYGTWSFVSNYGWCWIPGTVWAPAWVTWSYGHDYVGWAPMPPTVTFGASGYSGRPVVVSSSRYVFVPMNRFVGENVNSYRVSSRDNDRLFRETTHVTRFGVSGGYMRNTAIPVETIQKATGSRIQTHAVSEARVTPRQMTAGGSGKNHHYAIVAPAHEVKTAIARRPQTAAHAASPAETKQTQAKPASHPSSTSAHQESKPSQQTQHHETAQSHGSQHSSQPSQKAAPAQHAKPPAEHTPPPAQHAQAPAQHSQPPAHHTQPPPEHAKAPAHHTQPPPEHAKAPAHHTQPPPEHAKAPAQHTQPPPEHAKAPAQHTQPPAEHAKPPNQHAQPAAKKNNPDHSKPAPEDKNDGKH